MAESSDLSAREEAVAKYPDPMVVPSKLEHKQTIIIFHGRFTSGEIFAPKLLGWEVSEGQTLPDIFPHARFIFPTASTRNAYLYGNTPVRQWFDNWSLEEPQRREDLSVQGLRETSYFIHHLVEKETAVVGDGNVIIGAMSQGCAAMLISLLIWEKKAIPAAFGMCGWLPSRQRMVDATKASGREKHCDPRGIQATQQQAKNAITDLHKVLKIQLPRTLSMSYQDIPIFMGHGQQDDKVDFDIGQDTFHTLKVLGADVEFVGYPKLNHWFSSEMLIDIVSFIKQRAGWSSNDCYEHQEHHGLRN